MTSGIRGGVRAGFVYRVDNNDQRQPLSPPSGELLQECGSTVCFDLKSGGEPLHHLFEPLVAGVHGSRNTPGRHHGRGVDASQIEAVPVSTVRQCNDSSQDCGLPAARTASDDSASAIAVVRCQPGHQFRQHLHPPAEVQALFRLELHTARAGTEVLREVS
ncbi:hypothetical protein QR77_22030 [Streptomyces sp. 150FB]|nr:hypothetical protein QR77_22030 [Streptomyces sp. 150FB]